MNTLAVLVVVLCVYALAYRYYSAFLAAKVLTLSDARVTPAHTYNDGQNYLPTPKWVLFGHHFGQDDFRDVAAPRLSVGIVG